MTANSGVDTKSGEWTPAFEGQRPPFARGNEVAVTHGSYAVLTLRPRAGEIAERLRDALGDGLEEKHQAAIEAAALAGARVERAMSTLLADAEADGEELTREDAIGRLSQDARGWLRAYVEILDRLGLTPRVGQDGSSGPSTLIVVSAFPSVAVPHVELDVEAGELPAIEAGDLHPPGDEWDSSCIDAGTQRPA